MVIDVDSYDRAIELAGEPVGRPWGGRGADPRVARGAPVPGRAAHRHRVTTEVNEALLRSLTPSMPGILVVQDALVEAIRVWPADPLRDPKGWLVTAAWHRFLDATRVDAAHRRREDLIDEEPAPGPAPSRHSTLTRPPPRRLTGCRSSSGTTSSRA
jgi:hypothetical protein